MTLLLAGLLAAGLTAPEALRQHAQQRVDAKDWTESAGESFVASTAVSRVATAFGTTAGKIGILIALASVIGGCLSESGAAASIVDRILKWTGPRRAPEALAVSSFIIGIPVFFDTVFYLMVPLARSLRRIVGKDYVLFLMSILAGGSLAHSLIPPTPGPLQVAEILDLDVGAVLVAGLVIGGCSSVLALISARVINHFVDVPLREIAGEQPEPLSDSTDQPDSLANRPGLLESLLPILIPVVLITTGSVLAYLLKSGSVDESSITSVLRILGDKNIAIAIGLASAMPLTRYMNPERRRSLVGRSLGSAGNIILITAAGGAFGAMLRQAGIADAVKNLVDADAGL
ncbi:MAG: SLC13 family permease, partial [Planctomycetota bacterium]